MKISMLQVRIMIKNQMSMKEYNLKNKIQIIKYKIINNFFQKMMKINL